MVTRVAIVEHPIDAQSLLRDVMSAGNGAAILFVGSVRDVNEGRPVEGIEYTAYRPMAERELRAIVLEAMERFRVPRIAVEHRIGRLALEEISVAIAVGSPHRAEAYEASRYIIEELKRRVPIWKREQYSERAHRDWRQTPEGAQVLTLRTSGEVAAIDGTLPGKR
jgi:molybdopterin synthase catalytic subunit